MGAAVEHVDARCVLQPPHCLETPGHAGEQRRAVGHRAVDHLTLAGLCRVEQRARHAEGQHHAAATEIRSEEHTSELQSLMRISYAVFCLKKKTNPKNKRTNTHK